MWASPQIPAPKGPHSPCSMLTMGQAKSFGHSFASPFMTTPASGWLCGDCPGLAVPDPQESWAAGLLPTCSLCTGIGYIFLGCYPRHHPLTGVEFHCGVTPKITKSIARKIPGLDWPQLPFKGKGRISRHMASVFREKSAG